MAPNIWALSPLSHFSILMPKQLNFTENDGGFEQQNKVNLSQNFSARFVYGPDWPTPYIGARVRAWKEFVYGRKKKPASYIVTALQQLQKAN